MATAATTLWALGTVKTYLGLTDASDDTLVEQTADYISDLLERVTSRQYVTRTLTEERDGNGAKDIGLHQWPIVAITSIKIKRTITDTTPEMIASTDYTMHKPTGRIRLHNTIFTVGFANCEFVYSAGEGTQDNAALTRSIYHAGLELVKSVYDEKKTGVIAASAVSLGSNTFNVRPEIAKQIRMAVDANKRIGV